jgi:hypothetical protein
MLVVCNHSGDSAWDEICECRLVSVSDMKTGKLTLVDHFFNFAKW